MYCNQRLENPTRVKKNFIEEALQDINLLRTRLSTDSGTPLMMSLILDSRFITLQYQRDTVTDVYPIEIVAVLEQIRDLCNQIVSY